MFERYYRELLSFIDGIVRDRDLARDLVQESYVRVLGYQSAGASVAEPRALLYRIARNLVIDRHRRRQVVEATDNATIDAMSVADSVAGPATHEPEVAVASAQAVRVLLAAIDELPLRCREAFVLAKFDGLPQADVARKMGISVKMVERHLKLALASCRAARELCTPSDAAAMSPAASERPRT